MSTFCSWGILIILCMVVLAWLFGRQRNTSFKPRQIVYGAIPLRNSNPFSEIKNEVRQARSAQAAEESRVKASKQQEAGAVISVRARYRNMISLHMSLIRDVLDQLGLSIWEKSIDRSPNAYYPYYSIGEHGKLLCLFGHGFPYLDPFAVEIQVEDSEVKAYCVGRLRFTYELGFGDAPSITRWYLRFFRVEPKEADLIEGLKLAKDMLFDEFLEEKFVYAE